MIVVRLGGERGGLRGLIGFCRELGGRVGGGSDKLLLGAGWSSCSGREHCLRSVLVRWA